jgi:hypothetical protein
MGGGQRSNWACDRNNHAEINQKVRGIIIAREISDDLLLACSEIQSLDLCEYNIENILG